MILKKLFLLGFVMLAQGLLLSPAYAASAVFTVQDITVDVSAENALQAREKAFDEAQRKAFEKLAGRMLSDDQRSDFSLPETRIISSLIQDFEVTKEQLSDVRYIGTYTFRFRDEAVKNFFSNRGVRYSDVSSKPVLILPYYQRSGATILWSPYNIWRDAWNRADNLESGLVPLQVPLGDLTDVKDIGKENGLSYNAKDMVNMLRRYGAGEAVLTIASPDQALAAAAEQSADAPARGMLAVHIYRTDRQSPEFVQSLRLQARGSESVARLMDRGVQDVRDTLQRNWKDQTVIDPDEGASLRVSVNFDSLRQWAETKAALDKVYGLNDMRILSLTPQRAELDLIFQGSEQRLRLALKQADLVLSQPRINPGAITQAGFRYQSRTQAHRMPLTYNLYLTKYAPRDLQPVYRRDTAPESNSSSTAMDPADIAPQAGDPIPPPPRGRYGVENSENGFQGRF